MYDDFVANCCKIVHYMRGNQGAGRMGKNKKGARRTGKIYKGAERMNLIWEQGAGKTEKLEGSTEKKGVC